MTRRSWLSRLHPFRWLGGALAIQGLLASPGPARQAQGTTGKGWESFDLASLERKRSASRRPYLPFLDVPALSCGLYALAAGAVDRQSPHEKDEVYSITEGRAVLLVGEGDEQKRIPVKAGSVVYVKARVPHRFVEIEDPLKVLVFFAGR